MGALGALWVVLSLLEAEGQTSRPGLPTTQVLKTFQEDKFQGEWFVLGLAGSTHSKTDSSLLNPFTATFQRNKQKRLEVSYAMTRGQRCLTWSYVLIPTAQPGKFSVDQSRSPPAGSPAEVEEVQVQDTDYTTFALMLSRRQSGSQPVLRVTLLCRIWALQTQVLNKFICLVRAQGLSEDNVIFPDLTGWSPSLGSC
uniref:Lipocalin 12 n=2 Tax=Molossus molossus TaxID=27622 RepID=A0A7J8EDZ2_MOLMO|nr:lipocalin 12 [Molossus molossus]